MLADESYFFTQSLVEHSKNTVKQNPSNNDRLNQELDSFFKDLDESISKKQDFTIVGSLITVTGIAAWAIISSHQED